MLPLLHLPLSVPVCLSYCRCSRSAEPLRVCDACYSHDDGEVLAQYDSKGYEDGEGVWLRFRFSQLREFHKEITKVASSKEVKRSLSFSV